MTVLNQSAGVQIGWLLEQHSLISKQNKNRAKSIRRSLSKAKLNHICEKMETSYDLKQGCSYYA